MTERMTATEYLAAQKAGSKGAKRVEGAVPTEYNGIKFHSAREARRYGELLMLEKAGVISDLKLQVPMVLNGRNGPILTPTGRNMVYKADFTYFDNGLRATVVEDAKGHPTEVYTIKKAILAADGITVAEV